MAVAEVERMSGRITSSPKAQHYCNAGWRVETDEEAVVREAQPDVPGFAMRLPEGTRRLIEDRPWAAAGTIWTCDECGSDWKATYPYINVFSPTWVRHRPLKPIRRPWKRSKEPK